MFFRWTPLLLLFSSGSSFAADVVRAPMVVCASAEEAGASLEYCSQNAEVVNKSIDCYEELDRAWVSTAKELDKSLLGVQNRESTRQQGEMHFSKSDYATSVEKMSHLIATTEFNLARVHDYSKVMLDFIGAEEPEDSSSCYVENVAKLRRVEKQFERMIAEAKTARSSALALGGTSGLRETNVGSDTVNRVLASAPYPSVPAAPPAPYVKGKSPRKRSDITGTERSREKEILSAFKIRDQLTGP